MSVDGYREADARRHEACLAAFPKLNCAYPKQIGARQYVRCGKCWSCVKTMRQDVLASRIELEALAYEDVTFATLTYSDDHVPLLVSDEMELIGPTLRADHGVLFAKRLRKASGDRKLRLYIVGEYGERTGRPHYHLAVFGYPPCERGRTDMDRQFKTGSCCPPCDLIFKAWGKGGVQLVRFGIGAGQYLAAYSVKHLYTKGEKLGGREREYARWSRRPGLGVPALGVLIDHMEQHGFMRQLEDVPIFLARRGGVSLFLGEFLRKKLRLALTGDSHTPQDVLAQRQELLDWVVEYCVDHGLDAKQVLIDACEGRLVRLKSKLRGMSKGVL